MAVEMIELECPSCSELLELDLGFAGGVCRCSSCGTLMTVPTRSGRGQAEALTRPDRPDMPGGGRPEAPGRADSPISDAASSDASDTVTAEIDDEVASSAQTFVTSTGRVVTLDSHVPIPTAGKRKRAAIRIATVVTFCAVLVVVLVACIFAIITLFKASRAPTGPDLAPQALQLFTFDRMANPLRIPHPNILGLPMSTTTAIVLDVSGTPQDPATGEMRDAIHRFIVSGLNHPDVSMTVVLVGSDGSRPVIFEGGPTELASIDTQKLGTFLSQLKPSSGHVDDAIDTALSHRPDHLIIVTRQRLRGDDMTSMANVLASRPALLVDAVVIGTDSDALRDLVQSHRGMYAGITSLRLDMWMQEASP